MLTSKRRRRTLCWNTSAAEPGTSRTCLCRSWLRTRERRTSKLTTPAIHNHFSVHAFCSWCPAWLLSSAAGSRCASRWSTSSGSRWARVPEALFRLSAANKRHNQCRTSHSNRVLCFKLFIRSHLALVRFDLPPSMSHPTHSKAVSLLGNCLPWQWTVHPLKRFWFPLTPPPLEMLWVLTPLTGCTLFSPRRLLQQLKLLSYSMYWEIFVSNSRRLSPLWIRHWQQLKRRT